MNWNFNTTDLSKHINWHIDRALVEGRKQEKKRDYLGASIIGHDCERHIQYQYTGVEEEFTGQKLRIFERGHKMEKVAINALSGAGFIISFVDGNFEQFGFIDGDFEGHVDGVTIKSPLTMIEVPCVWEHKCLGSKYWKALDKNGLQEEFPNYYAQIQVYQAKMNLPNPALFTATNADTMEMYHELITHNPEYAKMQIAKAHRIIKETKEGKQCPRASEKSDSMMCKFCSFSKLCWKDGWVLGCNRSISEIRQRT